MLTARLIACLDIQGGRVVKGRRFEGLIDIGDPVEIARRYSDAGIDELVCLDISASLRGERPFFGLVEAIARAVAIPLTVGGGVRGLDDIQCFVRAGADKVTLNSVLVDDPEVLSEGRARFGAQAMVGAIDVKGGRIATKSATRDVATDALAWAETLVARGAGELLVTSVANDGMRGGYDVDFLKKLAARVQVPIVASGGAGNIDHLVAALASGADAVLVASLLHFNEMSVAEIKDALAARGVRVRRSGAES